MSLNPVIFSPASDFLFALTPTFRQPNESYVCVKLESKFLDCLDAYGTAKARENCAELLYDVIECSNHTAQMQRAQIMLKERMKQYREGKRSKPFEEYPALDSLLGL